MNDEFDSVVTEETIITNERINHIIERHSEDYIFFKSYIKSILKSPDVIMKDSKHYGTIFMVKKLSDTNLNAIVRVVLKEDNEKMKNSVMTFYRIRNKNLSKLEKK